MIAPIVDKVRRHPLPTPSHFAEAMSEIGIGDGATALAYDDAGGVIAARLVWMMHVIAKGIVEKSIRSIHVQVISPGR